jgi:T5orf172 domain
MTRIVTRHARQFGEGAEAVYGYTIDGIPGRIKIGRTTRVSYQQRILEQNTTGMPGRPGVEFICFTDDSGALERAVHAPFAAHRVPGKEWFLLTLEQVLESLKEYAEAKRRKAEEEQHQVEERQRIRGLQALEQEQRRQEALEQARIEEQRQHEAPIAGKAQP